MPAVDWKDKTLASLARMALVRRRIHALGTGGAGATSYSPLFTLVLDQLRGAKLTRRYRTWMST